MVADNLAERFAIATIATQGFHQQRDTGLVLTTNSNITWLRSGR